MIDPADLPAVLAAVEVRMLGDHCRGQLHAPDHYAADCPEAAAAIAVLHARLLDPAADARGQATGLAVADALVPAGPAAGQCLGDYRLERELGRGGQGVVFLAHDERLGRTVALKLLPLHGPWSQAAALRFRREAMVSARLDHPGICTVHDAGQRDGFAFIAMRAVDGRSLQQHLATLPPPPSPDRTALLPVLERVALALHHAHQHGVVHRDVKPGNILLGHDHQPVLVDFGLATDARDDGSRLTQSTDRLGTPAYMAPEQLDGGTVDARTDVYALGAVLHEALLGERPFRAASRDALFAAIQAGFAATALRRPVHAGRDLWAVLCTALARDPDRRYASALAFAEDLRALHLGTPVLARPPGTMRLLRTAARRHPVLATVVASLLVGLTVIAGVIAASNRELRAALGEARWLADARLVRSLAEGMLHVPVHSPEDAPALASWLARAEALAQRLPQHRARLEALRATALPYSATDAAADRDTALQQAGVEALRKRLEDCDRRLQQDPTDPVAQAEHERLTARITAAKARAGERRTFRFADPNLEWEHTALRELVDELTTFANDERGGLGRMRTAAADLQQAEALAADAAVQARWREVSDEIADTARSPAYHGLRLRPQFGLLPLGRDPHSGLQEFAHLRSGPPARRGRDGELELTDDTGVVLVLVPGGRFTPSHATGPVELQPFFLAKHEWTQAQYLRCRGDNTSVYAAGARIDDRLLTPRNPMENVAWVVADLMTRAMGLCLPTEAQWEWAARAGTTTTFWTGDDVAALAGKVNLFDASCLRAARRPPNETGAVPFDDGFAVHTVVDHEAANPWGIRGTIGNVAEWCADLWQNRPVTLRDGDGLSNVPNVNLRSIRGGSFGTPVTFAEHGSRSQSGLMDHGNTIGFRAARALER